MWGGGGGGCFFFNDTATTEIYTLSLHDALPIWEVQASVTSAPAAGQSVAAGGMGSINAEPLSQLSNRLLMVETKSDRATSELVSKEHAVFLICCEFVCDLFIGIGGHVSQEQIEPQT